MTIERQWIEIMKTEVPDAFTEEPPFAPEAAFIDAQIKLMAMPHEFSWDVYLHRQFVLPIHQMYSLGSRVVVLAFDDYANVPRAKAITQAKRREKITPIEFNAEQELPECPPRPWDAAMANRAFKAKVVEWIANEIPRAIELPLGAELYIDWKGGTLDRWAAGEEGAIKSEEGRSQVREGGARTGE